MFKNRIIVLLLALTLLISGCKITSGDLGTKSGDEGDNSGGLVFSGERKDDWQYDETVADNEYGYSGMMTKSAMMPSVAMEAAPVASNAGGNLGFAVGGAKDTGNFRGNIANGYLPIPTDITYEGLFYNYYFDTASEEECDKLFCPLYSRAVSADPLSTEAEYYLSVGLGSGMKEEDFARKKLNLVVVMDISGSMGSAFSQYYYDRFGNEVELEESEESDKSKMEIASKSVVALLDHLNDDDKLGVVLFDDSAFVAKPMSYVGETDMQAIKDHILEISDRGGTNMEAGMDEATKLLGEYTNAESDDYENRIIFITDAMPNIGETDRGGLRSMVEDNASDSIYTTFVGVGVDFNTDLIETLTKIRGANYYSVHSEKEFKKVMDDDFDYMVTPLVFDLNLQLKSDDYEIEKVYGSPEADESTGEIMKVNTLFPSKTEDGKSKGGVVLLKLREKNYTHGDRDGGTLKLAVSYEDRNGKKDNVEKEITMLYGGEEDVYDSLSIRKAILLVRYVNLIKHWLVNEMPMPRVDKPIVSPCPISICKDNDVCMEMRCIPPFIPDQYFLNQWERQSQELSVRSVFRKSFSSFLDYFEKEMTAIGDQDLKQELDVLETLK